MPNQKIQIKKYQQTATTNTKKTPSQTLDLTFFTLAAIKLIASKFWLHFATQNYQLHHPMLN
ncbi:hypothetical protein ACF3N0_02080 [Moraxella atlantae]|uniref:hypothetical protein n=1 Tax=Faucicola atlantae TaxID=34059 RepID=UPI003750B120